MSVLFWNVNEAALVEVLCDHDERYIHVVTSSVYEYDRMEIVAECMPDQSLTHVHTQTPVTESENNSNYATLHASMHTSVGISTMIITCDVSTGTVCVCPNHCIQHIHV